MADTSVPVTGGSGYNIDGFSQSGGDIRQAVVIGDPSASNTVPVQATDPNSNSQGLVVRDVNTSAIVGVFGGSGIKVRDIVTGTISTVASVTNIANSVAVHIGSTGGTLWVKPDPAGTYFTNAGHTSSIFTTSGTAAGTSASGQTIISPSANYSFKIFAFSLQTTGIVSLATRFTNGAGTSPTEYWRPLVTSAASSSSPVGANLAVTPPGYLFATGANTTLALLMDTSTLVHYSVSYIKESA